MLLPGTVGEESPALKDPPSLNVLQQRPSTNVPHTRLTAAVASYSAGLPLRPAPIDAVQGRTG